MRHDEERPLSSEFLADGTLPGHWTQVLATMRASAFTRLSLDDILAAAAHLLIVAPSPQVARACFDSLPDGTESPGIEDGFIEVIRPEELVAEHVPAGTWVFLPHRHDGWTELEETSAKLRATLVRANRGREREAKLILIEYGVNLWMWAEPPSSGGDPVCHAGELISWESAWALEAPAAAGETSTTDAAASSTTASASARPPIYFGLPPVLRERRSPPGTAGTSRTQATATTAPARTRRMK